MKSLKAQVSLFGQSIAVCVTCLILFGCSKDEPASGVAVMKFNIDPEQLGESVLLPDMGIQFQPPVGWMLLPVADLDSLGRPPDAVRLAGIDSLALEPLRIFLDTDDGSVLSVSELQFATGASFEERMNRYGSALASRFPQDSVRETSFMKDGVHMAQFLVQPQGLVNFKVVFEVRSGALLQFDYVVSVVHYPEEVRAVESSIASIVKTS